MGNSRSVIIPLDMGDSCSVIIPLDMGDSCSVIIPLDMGAKAQVTLMEFVNHHGIKACLTLLKLLVHSRGT